MEWLLGFAVIGIMFLLRLVVPFLSLALLVGILHRLNTRWEAA